MLNLAIWTDTGDTSLGYKMENSEGKVYYESMQGMLETWDADDPK